MADIVKENKAEIITDKKAAFDRLQQVENALREESFDIVSGVMAFADISADEETIPQSWIDEYGYVAALKRFRLAKYGQMGAKEAPVAVKVAASICTNIIKARGAESNIRPLNLTLVKVTSNHCYEAKEVDE